MPERSPDEERVERAAKALWTVQSELKLVSFDLLGPNQRNELRKQARAALAAAEREEPLKRFDIDDGPDPHQGRSSALFPQREGEDG